MSQQRTIEWYRSRLGKITGSAVGELMSNGREKGSVFSQKGLTYLNSVAAERMIPREILNDDEYLETYLYETSVSSKAMRIGTEREQEARELYQVFTGNHVEELSSVEHPQIKGFASSPDGAVAGDGVLEIKSPTPSKYMEYLTQVRTAEELKKFNAVYYWQCMAHMSVTGARWCDFTVYCPFSRVPIHIVSLERDTDEIQRLEKRVSLGLDYVENLLQGIGMPAALR